MKVSHRLPQDAYIGLGSNLDNPIDQIERAFELLAVAPQTELTARSSLYRSAPFGGIEQPDFINSAAKLRTDLGAWALLTQLQEIERLLGRVRTQRWGPRIIDLDLLLYGEQQIAQALLTVPHPGIGVRNFVLLPLREIEPDLVIPGLGRIADIAVDEATPKISRLTYEEGV